ncbi:MAG: type II toxin-antitoxin system VapC family toxin [Candidatus Thiodiazotropha weberae]|uniref:Ribonuclease n=1 Tax=Candidatus Thiodiazotropha endoloripes TaxID=1818881 RepID=A0A1E2UQ23_9GAMM|nr:type II toxin-antitoxin system VapC family toxin [Candidatus Thiodiazotropha endoloripes]MCG7899011.1 type II toxin-antitoxin system VapC family toxin [Candidatus Thiodiazotropha weberae]ODB96632.1 ribonuclease [Candidatus Thiodiazotropha endoloripes]
MILVDTSIWIDHLRSGDTRLADLLAQSQVLAHPFVVGELACGNLRNRDEILRLLNDLPQSPIATPAEALHFIESHHLMGLGVGYIDIHLLAATALAENARLWTGDKRLKKVSSEMKLVFDE